MICKGVGGSLELSEDFVTIRRSAVLGFLMQHGIKGEKRIPYSAISAVQFKLAGVARGYIQFTIVGGNENRGGLLAASGDENTLMFRDNYVFEKARDFIEKRIGIRSAPQMVAVQSSADQLEKLAGLLDRGLLTKEEFDEQKSTLLKPADSSRAEPLEEKQSEDFLRMQAAMDKVIVEKPPSMVEAATAPTVTFGKRH
jgi:hypothetical protein